ncbi:EthD family reductase [Terrimonas sp. NA20]|uniref:EthD family reductase n=1 Tax=Terrimonas ginsenosidimutans TaxID=2908004 RepID=A0ABS9KLU2_9BACT|nr:EthD family reductase [Terrimonas ginsenosidimutans]MCG2613291.1 EthD family reductase [Terrimonas ginsenosidimutans]
MIKATVLYGHPSSPEEFEKYYKETHDPLVNKTAGIVKKEYTRFLQNADGSAPVYYRMAELCFESGETMQRAMASEEGKAMAADLSNFATGGVKIIVGIVEN